MNHYQAPLRDIQFLLREVFEPDVVWADFLAQDPDASLATAMAALSEAGKFAASELAPINRSGDEQGAQWHAGAVSTPAGFRQAFADYGAGGWLGFTGNPEFGGLGMPKRLSVHLEEMLHASNPGFALYTVLSSGATLAIDTHASAPLKQQYLGNMYAGKWAGSMCLTEPHCGTDLGLIRTRAEPQADGSFAISGTKIFITGGEHDLAENIIHLVLARLPDAPPGPKGISLFLVPKRLLDDDGCAGPANLLSCGSIEQKMGIKASATCVMNFDGAKGWLVGEPGKGLAAMFTMMNYERLTVGIQGIGCAYASYLNAVDYAKTRLQGRAPGRLATPDAIADPIIHHPDVRRMLLTMRAFTEGGRALATYLGGQLDQSQGEQTAERRSAAQARVALLTPVAKAFLTDAGMESCLLGQQVFGGHGYIRETGQEQWVRDVRIAQIYEGTNGVQALDLLGRKVLADEGKAFRDFLKEVCEFAMDPQVVHRHALLDAVMELEEATDWIKDSAASDPRQVGAASVEYLHLFGYVVLGYLWSRMATVARRAQDSDKAFYSAKLATADFFFARLLPRIHGLSACIHGGAKALYGLADNQF